MTNNIPDPHNIFPLPNFNALTHIKPTTTHLNIIVDDKE